MIPARTFWHFAGAGYVGFAVLSFVSLRADPIYGMVAIIWLFAVIWLADTMAYFFGKTIGGPKLWPQVSPNKTWAGLAGAMTGALCGALLTGIAANLPALTALAIIGLIMGVIEQGGDLFESALKRRFGVKDSGNLIPGHGGVLDRVDGLMAASVAMWLTGMVHVDKGGVATGVFVW